MEFNLQEIYNCLTLFGSSFSLIGLLGFQSQLVRDKAIIPAFITSTGIGFLQLMVYKAAPSANLMESFAYILGGSTGIVSSIYAHNFWLKIIKK